MKIGPLEFACNFPDWLLTLGEQGLADTGGAADLWKVCVHVSTCRAAAVAQREQLRSAPHTSFVLGLSRLANGAQHPSAPAPPRLSPPKKNNFKNRKGLPGMGFGRIYSVDGEGPRLLGQRGCQRLIGGQQSSLDHSLSSLTILDIQNIYQKVWKQQQLNSIR